MEKRECPKVFLESAGCAEKVASVRTAQTFAKHAFDLAFNPEKFYNFVLCPARPGGDFRDLSQDGLLFRANRKHLQDYALEGLAETETWVWNLKVGSDAKFIPNQFVKADFGGASVDATPVEDFDELNFNNKTYRWSSYQRDILIDGSSIK